MHTCMRYCFVTTAQHHYTHSAKSLTPLQNQAEPKRPALPSSCGIVPRAVQQIFKHVEDCKRRGNQITVTMSFLQIYLEEVSDLLAPIMSPQSAGRKLTIREDPKHGIFVEGLNHMILDGDAEESATLVLRAVKAAVAERATSSTAQNSHSSRSHALLQFTIQQYGDDENENTHGCNTTAASGHSNPNYLGQNANSNANKKSKRRLKRSVLSIVDLAGSERVSKSGSEGVRLEEAKRINRSISALGNCVSALAGMHATAAAAAAAANESNMNTNSSVPSSSASDSSTSASGPSGHVPFRDSKLTRLLTNSLGGNSKTCVCATVGPNSR